MQGACVEPNLITYNALIHACAQVRRARRHRMHAVMRLSPRMDHTGRPPESRPRMIGAFARLLHLLLLWYSHPSVCARVPLLLPPLLS